MALASPSLGIACGGAGATRDTSLLVLGRRPFFGCVQALRCSPSSSFSPCSIRIRKHGVTTAVIKRKKDYQLDNVIQREKKLKIVLRIKELLVKQPGQVMSLRDLGKYRKYIGLTGKRRCIAMLNRFPAVFQVYEEGVNAKWFRFTKQAKAQYLEELKLKEEMEEFLVTKLRKLLMMSIDQRILVEKINHIRRELGLPDDFKTGLLKNYPQFFRVAESDMGDVLELTHWDPELAVTALEKADRDKVKARRELEEDLAKSLGEEAVVEEDEDVLARVPRFKKKLNLPKGYSLKKKDKENLIKFQEVPVISPYADTTQLNPATAEAEKHAMLVVHELLSLTLEKKILVDHLTHFRRDFQFSQRVRSLLIRHPEMFYVSLKGTRDSVFLRDAYDNSELKEKDPLVLVKERMAELVAQGKKDEKLDEISDDDEDDLGDGEDDDDWDDDEDEEFLAGKVGNSSLQRQRMLAVANIDDTPRERW